MSEQPTDQEKYLRNLESLFTIAMHKLGNDVEISDAELANISPDMTLDVTTTETGLRLRMVEDVQE
jgi:hypothetical protein